MIYGQRVLPDGTVVGAGVNERVSEDPYYMATPSAEQASPAMAYNPSAGNALVAWHDHGHYSEVDAGYWGIWGRMWAPAWRQYLPVVLKSY